MFAGRPAAETTAAPENPLLNTNTVVWAGSDYSLIRIIGPNLGLTAGSIFPAMPDSWNRLFVWERIGKLGKELDKRMLVDVGGMTERNHLAGPNQVIPVGGAGDAVEKSHITPDIIAKAVRGYKLENKSGVAVVFIVDRFVKLDKKGEGAVYVVAFDIGSGEVLYSERVMGKAVGFGFRNYWFRVIKDSEKGLKNLR